MKKLTLINIVLAGICGLLVPAAGQNTHQQGKVHMFTDRTLYITGEQIQFSAMLQPEKDSLEKILYVELITPDGKRIIGGKFGIKDFTASGCLTVPGNMVTGNYYLRAYTRYMRNAGSAAFDYIPLKLVNPANKDVLTLNSRATEGKLIASEALSDRSEIVTQSTDKIAYHAREKALISIRELTAGPSAVKGMCLSVIPENTLVTDRYMTLLPEEDLPSAEKIFRMETRGVSISGQLVEKASGKPVSDGIVTLSVMGDKDFSAFRTDLQGRFFFALPDYPGSRDIFLSAAGLNQSSTSLLIDNDFSTVPVNLPNPVFRMSEEEKKASFNLAVNHMVDVEFRQPEAVAKTDSTVRENRSFYGLPTETLIMDKFVQLPTLEEYFNELPLEVRVKVRKEGKYFKFNSKDAAMMANDPLVLVDWVVMSDVEKLMQLSPQRIEKIEIVNKPYVKGNLTYGGIISILSRQGDFAGIDLPGSGLFLKYELLSPGCGVDYSSAESANLPDARNTIYWKPVMVALSGKHEISVTMPDTPGNYVIVIRGLLQDGTVFSQSVTIRVE